MIICVCNALSESDIRRHAADGVPHFELLRETTGCSGCCGCCEPDARRVFDEAQRAVARPLSGMAAAA